MPLQARPEPQAEAQLSLLAVAFIKKLRAKFGVGSFALQEPQLHGYVIATHLNAVCGMMCCSASILYLPALRVQVL